MKLNKYLYALVKQLSLVLLIGNGIIACSQNDTDSHQPEDSPEAVTTGVTENEILLGSSSALSGHASFLGTQYTHGSNSWFNEINAKGGIHGRKIRFITYDDQYDPPKTIDNTNKLIFEDKVFMLFDYVGTPTSVNIIDFVQENAIPSFGFFTGAEALRTPFRPHMFHVRASYYEEAEGAIKYFVDKLGFKNIAVLYQDDAFGKAVLKGVQLALHKRDLEISAIDSYTRGSLDVEHAVDNIKKSGAEAVIMVGTYSPLAKFIKLSHDNEFKPFFHTVSFIGSEAFSREIQKQKISPEMYKQIIVTQVVPSPLSGGLEIVKKYRKIHLKHYPDDKPNYVALEGFINAYVLAEALKNAGPDLTREKLVKSIESIKNLDIGLGNKINYGEYDHQGLTGVYYSRLSENGNFVEF